MGADQKKGVSRAPSMGDWLGFLVGGPIGALIVGLAAKIANPTINSGPSQNHLSQQLAEACRLLTVWDIPAILVLYLFAVGIHEIGHILGGLSQGMRFLLLIIGPFAWLASDSGTRFEWNTNPTFLGGAAATLPTKAGASLRRQLLMLNAGGPIASLLLASAANALATVSAPRFAAYCTFVAAASFGIFLITLLPLSIGGSMSDGMQISNAFRGGSAVIEHYALSQIFAQILRHVRPRDWDSSAIDELSRLSFEDPLRFTSGLPLLLARAMDCRHDADIARYRELLEAGVDGYPSGFRQSIHIELAVCAWLAGDTDAVRRHLEAGQGGIVEKSRRLLALAALAKLEGRDEDCERDRLLAIKALTKASDAGQRKLTEDQLAMLQSRS